MLRLSAEMMIDEQDAVEMIHLVLQAGGQEAFGGKFPAAYCRGRGSAPGPPWPARHLGVMVGHRQAAFLVAHVLVRGPDDLGIGHAQRLPGFVLAGDIEHDRRASARRPAAPPGRCRAPRTSSPACRPSAGARRHRPSSTGLAFFLRRGSGAVRMGKIAMVQSLSSIIRCPLSSQPGRQRQASAADFRTNYER